MRLKNGIARAKCSRVETMMRGDGEGTKVKGESVKWRGGTRDKKKKESKSKGKRTNDDFIGFIHSKNPFST
jgi:hypothetical protein